MYLKRDVGRRIAVRRKLLGISQEELAARIAPPVSRQSVEKWEKGDNAVALARLPSLCDVLACTADYVLGRTGGLSETTVAGELTAHELRVVAAFRTLPDETLRRHLLRSMEVLTAYVLNEHNPPPDEPG